MAQSVLSLANLSGPLTVGFFGLQVVVVFGSYQLLLLWVILIRRRASKVLVVMIRDNQGRNSSTYGAIENEFEWY
jgi:hypothetical protein